MLECKLHADTVAAIEADEYHQLDTRFFRRMLKCAGIKLVSKEGEVLITESTMSCRDNIVHVAILGKLGYTFRRVKLNNQNQVIVS